MASYRLYFLFCLIASTGNSNDATNGITEDMLANALSSLQNQQVHNLLYI